MQLHVMCNLSYATTQISSYMCRMQLNFSCKRQLQNPKFLVVDYKAILATQPNGSIGWNSLGNMQVCCIFHLFVLKDGCGIVFNFPQGKSHMF
jgi:hypothetical protein